MSESEEDMELFTEEVKDQERPSVSSRSGRASKKPDRLVSAASAAPARVARAKGQGKGKSQAKGNRKGINAAKTSQTAGKGGSSATRRSGRASSTADGKLAEADSDDDFARKNFMFSSDDDSSDERPRKTAKAKSGASKTSKKVLGDDVSSCSSSGADSDSDATDDDAVDYRIQYILGAQLLTPAKWRTILAPMQTREVTRGSVWQMPDEEFFSDSDVPVERLLIKWQHASFLHVSWETEQDLLDLVKGTSVKNAISKFRNRELLGLGMFEDLGRGEYFLPEFVQVDRVLDIEDNTVDILDLDPETAVLPSDEDMSDMRDGFEVMCAAPEAPAPAPGEADGIDPDVDDDAETSDPDSKKRGAHPTPADPSAQRKTKKSKVGALKWLHGGQGWLTIKWAGMAYSDSSVESLEDLRTMKVDYEKALRAFYAREHLPPATGAQLKRMKRALKSPEDTVAGRSGYMESDTPPVMLGGELRDYQWEGVRWMLFNWSQRRNSILADEMGLGKTIQTAAFLQLLKSRQAVRGPFLIVAPLSVVINWEREMKAWTDMDVVVYHGSADDRELIRSHEFKYRSREQHCGHRLEVVVTTPETCLASDHKTASGRVVRALSRIEWAMLVVDEAHKLKNHTSRISCTLRDEFRYSNSLLLTGTPLQNSTEELWTLLNFVDNKAFGSKDHFTAEFGDLQSSSQLANLHNKIGPYLLRREKEAVEKSVPPKEEVIIEVELTNPQKQYYRAIYEMNTAFLCKAGAKEMPSLTNLAMEIRKCCNHPFLIKGAETEITKHFDDATPVQALTQASGKMVLLDKLLPKLKRDGHRVLIFSQFRIMLNLLEDYMQLSGHSYERIDGAVTGKKRQAAIDRYSNPDSDLFVMLLSTRAGGVGINLTAADTVIIYDSDWNPQNDLQAQARAHRIGQEKTVMVYRLLTKKTYEQRMFEVASMKLGLDYAVMSNLHGFKVGDKKESQTMSTMSKKELENLLKHGAYDMFKEDDGKDEAEKGRAAKEFCDADIEHILARSTKVVHDGKTAQANESAQMSFAKASFVAAGGAETETVNVDDPDFWNKIVGLSVAADQEEELQRRKCRVALADGAYKEPGMTFAMLEKSAAGDDGYDSELSLGAVSKARREARGRTKKNKDEIEQEAMKSWPTEPTGRFHDDIATVLPSLCAYGFGAWKSIKRDARVRWGDRAVARVCRLAVVTLLVQACAQEHKKEKDATAAAMEDMCDGDMVLDMTAVLARLAHSRLCRLALCTAALTKASDADDEASTETVETVIPLENLVLGECVMQTHTATPASNTDTTDADADVDAGNTTASIPTSTSDRLCDISLSAIASVPGLEGLSSLADLGRLSAGHYHYITPKLKKKTTTAVATAQAGEEGSGDTGPQDQQEVDKNKEETPFSAAEVALRQRDEKQAEMRDFLNLLLNAPPSSSTAGESGACTFACLQGLGKTGRQRAKDRLSCLEDLLELSLVDSMDVLDAALATLTGDAHTDADVDAYLASVNMHSNTTPVESLIRALEMNHYVEMKPFQQPVDVAEVQGYKKYVRRPMDLTHIRHYLDTKSYDNYLQPVADLRLMFHNAKTFNKHHMDEDAVSKAVYDAAVTMETMLARLVTDVYVTSIRLSQAADTLRKAQLTSFLHEHAKQAATADMETGKSNKDNFTFGYEDVVAAVADRASVVVDAETALDEKDSTPAPASEPAQMQSVSGGIHWSAAIDAILLHAVGLHGMPDSRHRHQHVVQEVAREAVTLLGLEPRKTSITATASAVVATDGGEESAMDVVIPGAEGAPLTTTDVEAQGEAVSDDDDDDNDDARQRVEDRVALALKLTERSTVIKRVRALCKVLRGADALPLPVNHYTEEVRVKVRKEKPAAVAPPLNEKKLVMSVLKVLGRTGRPRKIYAAAQGEATPGASRDDENKGEEKEGNETAVLVQVPEDRRDLLITWPEVHLEVCQEYSARPLVHSVVTMADVQDITSTIITARKSGPCRDPKLKIPTFDALQYPRLAEAQVHPKLVVECCDRMETAHRVRCALAFLGDAQLESCLRDCNRVPGVGPSTPSFQRDNNLPVWWSYNHDVRLLRECLTQGHQFTAGVWKRLQAADAARRMADHTYVSLISAPDNYDVPPRDKTDWVMELTPKAAEKRIGTITRCFDLNMIARFLSPAKLPPGSPVLSRSSHSVGLSSMFKPRGSAVAASSGKTASSMPSTARQGTDMFGTSKPKTPVFVMAAAAATAAKTDASTTTAAPAPKPVKTTSNSTAALAAQLAAIEEQERALEEAEKRLAERKASLAKKKKKQEEAVEAGQERDTIDRLKIEEKSKIHTLVERAQAKADAEARARERQKDIDIEKIPVQAAHVREADVSASSSAGATIMSSPIITTPGNSATKNDDGVDVEAHDAVNDTHMDIDGILHTEKEKEIAKENVVNATLTPSAAKTATATDSCAFGSVKRDSLQGESAATLAVHRTPAAVVARGDKLLSATAKVLAKGKGNSSEKDKKEKSRSARATKGMPSLLNFFAAARPAPAAAIDAPTEAPAAGMAEAK